MLAKYIYTRIIKLYFSKGFFSRLSLLIFQEIRTQYLKKSNPSFDVDIRSIISKNGNCKQILKFDNHQNLIIPFSYSLPIILTVQPFYSLNYPRIAKILNDNIANFKLIDIGANIGDGVYLCRLFSEFPILCIEGDFQYFELLKRNISNHRIVESYFSFIGKDDTTTKVNVDKKEGTLSLVENSAGGLQIDFKRLSTVLTERPEFVDFKMIKIDTDGFDVDIIKSFGERELINNPVIFFEYDPHFVKRIGTDPFSVFQYLIDKGYSEYMFYDNLGYLITSVNSTQLNLLKELHNYFDNRNGKHYFDICAFHASDKAIFNLVLKEERHFFESASE